jgi:hypothetical protein
VRTSRFTPGFVVRNGGLLAPAEVGAGVDVHPEAGEGAGGGASSPAISAMFQLNRGPAGGRSSKTRTESLGVLGLWPSNGRVGPVNGLKPSRPQMIGA